MRKSMVILVGAQLFFSMVYAEDMLTYLSENTGYTRSIVNKNLKEINQWCGWLERDWRRYYYVMPQIINERSLKVGCEVGVSMGGNSESILRNTKVTHLYSVDPYMPNKAGQWHLGQDYHDIVYYWVKWRLRSFGDRSTVVRNFSKDAAEKFEDESLDFVFIDGDHSYEAVKLDLELWYPKVRQGGIVAGDDYGTACPGVPQAVDEFFENKGLKFNLHPEQPRIWWMEKE